MTSSELTFLAQSEDGTCLLSVVGRIDSSNAAQLTEKVREITSGQPQRVVLDFAELMYLTSAGFRALLIASDDVGETNGSLALCNVNGDVRELFEMGGMLDVFTIFDTREAALGAKS